MDGSKRWVPSLRGIHSTLFGCIRFCGCFGLQRLIVVKVTKKDQIFMLQSFRLIIRLITISGTKLMICALKPVTKTRKKQSRHSCRSTVKTQIQWMKSTKTRCNSCLTRTLICISAPQQQMRAAIIAIAACYSRTKIITATSTDRLLSELQ